MKRTGFKTRGKPLERQPFQRKQPPALATPKPRKQMRQRSDTRRNKAEAQDAWYLAEVHNLGCCVCEKFGMQQTSPTEAHHPICGRFSSRKARNLDAIPLCKCHHQGLLHDRDRRKLAIHQGKASWVNAYGEDTDYIAETQLNILGEIDF